MEKADIQDYKFLFILDAVRKDHTSLYNYGRNTTPFLKEISNESTIFNWSFAPSSFTRASVPSILTAKYSINTINGFSKIPSSEYTLIKDIKQKGYKTALFTANIITSSEVLGLDSVFDYVWEDFNETEINRPDILFSSAKSVFLALKKYVDNNKNKKNFIVVHLMEAHGPYTPDIESIFEQDKIFNKDKRKITRIAPDSFLGITKAVLDKYAVAPRYQLLNTLKGPNGEIEDYETNVNKYIAKYDMGIRKLDDSLKEFINYLKFKKLYDSSTLAITTDHGELLGENNIFFSHGNDTSPALINIFLLIKFSGQKQKKEINSNTSLIDIIPTIFNLESKLIDGKNALKKDKQELIYSFHPQCVSVIDKNLMLMLHNGPYSSEIQILQNKMSGDLLFLTKEMEIKNFVENFSKFNSDTHISFFKKNNSAFKEVKNIDKYDVSSMTNHILKLLLQKNFSNLSNKITTIDDQFKKDFETIQNQIDNLEKIKKNIINLETLLNQKEEFLKKIQDSEWYKLWQSYNYIKKIVKNKL